MTPNSRSYLNRFTQPDSIIPSPANLQSLNRYSYVGNNPTRYTDPSGYASCAGANWDDGPKCAKTDKGNYINAEYEAKATTQLQQAISQRYKWAAAASFSLNYLINIYQTGMDIERYVDSLTGGNGLAWMNKNVANINITVNFTSFNGGGSFELPGTIFLNSSLNQSDQAGQIRADLAHEVAEMWDWRSGHICPFGYGGYCSGVADQMNQAFGGDVINDPFFNRGNNTYGNPINLYGVPKKYQWSINGYANGGTQDYFAEAFSISMEPNAGKNADHGPIPAGVQDWLNAEIQHYAP